MALKDKLAKARSGFVDDAGTVWRYFSVQAMALSIIILSTWGSLPDDLKSALPAGTPKVVASVLLALGILGRFVKQGPVDCDRDHRDDRDDGHHDHRDEHEDGHDGRSQVVVIEQQAPVPAVPATPVAATVSPLEAAVVPAAAETVAPVAEAAPAA